MKKTYIIALVSLLMACDKAKEVPQKRNIPLAYAAIRPIGWCVPKFRTEPHMVCITSSFGYVTRESCLYNPDFERRGQVVILEIGSRVYGSITTNNDFYSNYGACSGLKRIAEYENPGLKIEKPVFPQSFSYHPSPLKPLN